MTPTRVASWNMGSRKDAEVLFGLNKLRARGAHVIGLQEAGDRHGLIEAFCGDNGWGVYYGADVPGAASVPILWNPKIAHQVARGTRQVTPPTYVGRLGAGPSTMKAKVWNFMRFQDAPVVINGHIVPSVYLPRRRRIARLQIEALADMAERRGERGVQVVGIGDFNMRVRSRLTRPLRQVGMVQRTHKPTHGRRLIDHVWTLDCRGSVEVVPMPSDHRAVLFTLI